MSSLPLVYILGDSISIQYGPYLEKYLAGFWRYDRKRGEAEALLNLDQPQGANGGDSSMVLDFLQATLKASDFHPDLLLVNCGAHDIKTDRATNKTQVPLSGYQDNLRKIVQLCAENKITLVWVQSTHQSDEIHNIRYQASFLRHAKDRIAYDEAARQIMTNAHVPIIHLGDFTCKLGPDDELFCDHAHYHETVREKQGIFIAGWLLARRELCGI
jgi:lysophospholipase L1-like esterase